MNNTEKQEKWKVENYKFESDFQLLTLNEKRRILKDAKVLLSIQKQNDISYSLLPQEKTDAFC